MLGSIAGDVRFKEPLSVHTSLRLGGPADIFIAPENVDDIRHALAFAGREQMPATVIGTGTHTGTRPDLPASGNAIEVQGSAFLTLDDDKIVEAWSVFDSLALAVQTGTAEEPAWWPARREAS